MKQIELHDHWIFYEREAQRDHAEKIATALREDFAICPDSECAADGGGTFLGTFCDACGLDTTPARGLAQS